MTIRLLVAEDVADYRRLRFAALAERPPAFGALAESEPALPEMAARLAATEDRCFFGALDGGRLIGTLRLSRYSSANEKHRAYLAGLFVTPPFRRHGCGKALVQAALHRSLADRSLRRLNLTVVSGQCAAIRLYETFGFVKYGTERDAFCSEQRYYDEHLMTLDLTALRQSQ